METGQITVAGGNGAGSEVHQFNNPYHVCIDDSGNMIISQFFNHRITEWKPGTKRGRVVAGDNGKGNRLNQLKDLAGFIIDPATDSLIICDYCDRWLVRWPHHGVKPGEVPCNMDCLSLKMDDHGFLYVYDFFRHDVRIYRIGDN